MRTMVNLPDTLHKGLKHLAVERGTSLAELIREALETLYKEDLEDIEVGRRRLATYVAESSATPYGTSRKRRLKI